jgi:hypothetical protein
VIFGTTCVGLLVGRSLRKHVDNLREPFAALQGALLGLVALIMAFGLSLALGRYDARRTAEVDEANSIGTTYLRAQTIAEPQRSRSLDLIRSYTDTSILVAKAIPESDAQQRAVARGAQIQRQLWKLAGEAMNAAPRDSAPRLYVDTLNDTIDSQTVRVSGLNNRVPGAVLTLEIVGAAAALGLLAAYLALMGRGVLPVVLAAALVSMLLLVTFDLDRPTRGLIRVPVKPLTDLRKSMTLPPAAPAPVARAG